MPVKVVRIQARPRGRGKRGLRVTVRPQTLHLWRKKRHQARWRVTGGHAVVRFGKRSPFKRRKFLCRRGGAANSGSIRAAAKGRYRYGVRVSGAPMRDPQIIIH